MTVKKNAINISIIMIFASILVTILCWPYSNTGVAALLYTLSTGVFGSSFATLWIFVYEYNRSKQELLQAIFDETVSIMENNTLCFLSRFGYHEAGMKESMVSKPYIPPAHADAVNAMDKQERCHYELCRFVDEMLDIGYDRIKYVCNLAEGIDFWSDGFRRKDKRRDAIIHKLSMPLYEVFVCAPAMEDGYLFRYFKGFKTSHTYCADEVYPFVAMLDKALHVPDAQLEFSWPNPMTLSGYMHEQLWIFRDAFYSSHIDKKQRRQAMQAFLNGSPYPYIR